MSRGVFYQIKVWTVTKDKWVQRERRETWREKRLNRRKRANTREGEILKGRKTLRTSLVPVGYPVWVKEKPSKLEVWGLKSRFNFQAFPAAFHGLPAVYLFWINVINPPVPSVTQKKRVTVKKITRPLLLVHRAQPTQLGGSEISYHRIIFCLGLTWKSSSDSSQGNVSQMPRNERSGRRKTSCFKGRSLQVLEGSHMHWCGLEKKLVLNI